VLLIDVATTSADVGGSASRLAKTSRIAELLSQAKTDPALVAIVVAWLSGELPQRQIGVGYAALRSLPPAAIRPSLTVHGVDAMLSAIGAVAGKGSQARRTAQVTELFAAATEVEQIFLRRLLTGELRQGALVGVMADAVAKAARLPAAAVRRAAMLGGALPAVAAAALTDGTAALDEFTLQVGRPVGPMLAQTAASVTEALEKHGGTAVFEAKLDGARVQIHRAGDQVSVYTRSLDDVTARLPEVVEATLALPVHDLIADGEAIALRPDGRPQPFQITGARFGRSVDVAAARTTQPLSVFFFDILHRDGVDLLDAPTSERVTALGARVGCGARVVAEPVGCVLDCDDHSDRPVHGLLSAIPVPRGSARSIGNRFRPADARCGVRPFRQPNTMGCSVVEPVTGDGVVADRRVRIRCIGAAGVVAAGSTRLLVHVHEGGCHCPAGDRYLRRAPDRAGTRGLTLRFWR
jgi:ATP-dependent DNA ligase